MSKLGIISLIIAISVNMLLQASNKYNNEVFLKRTRFSKTIKRTGNNFELAIFNHPVHFKNEQGKWQPIDPKFISYQNGYANFKNIFHTIVNSERIRLDNEIALTLANFL
ncbi:hypothetical protein ACX8XN_02720 [Calditrichota bacterium GD2]